MSLPHPLQADFESCPGTSVPLPSGFVRDGGNGAVEHGDAQPELRCVWCQPHHVIREGSQPASSGMCPEMAAKVAAELDALDELTYRSYRHNRELFPARPVDGWRRVFGANVDRFEQRFLAERSV